MHINGVSKMEYYKIKDLGENIFSIFEIVGVGEHLIIGEDKALLIDTGYGYGNLRKEIKKICNKPLIVVNSHAHVDHCFGNSQFEKVFISKEDMPVFQTDELQKQKNIMKKYGVKVAPMLRFVFLYGKLKKKPFYNTSVEKMPDNMSFELGNREIGFMVFPGHTKGSMIALDQKAKTIFAGDAVNPGVFLFFDKELRLEEYARKLEELSQLTGYEKVIISHSVAPLPFAFIKWYADFLRRVTLENSVKTDFPNEGRTVLQYTEHDEGYGECSVFYCEENLRTEANE